MLDGRMAVVLALLVAGCGLAVHDSKKPATATGSIAYQLQCHSIVDVKAWVTYTVTASEDPVAPGAELTLRVAAPPAAVDSALTATFVESKVTYPIPSGFEVDDVSTDPASTGDINESDVKVDNGSILFHETGSFPLDGKSHDLPLLVVTGHVTAPSGTAIAWMTPTELDGKASIGLLGDQSSTCTVIMPGPIWTIHVH